MKTIILDTNFIAYCIKYKIDFKQQIKDLLPNHEIKIIDKTIQELKKLKNYKLTLQLIKNIKKIKSKEPTVDQAILNQNNIIVATLDKELKKKLKDKNIPTITLRKKKYISTESFIKQT